MLCWLAASVSGGVLSPIHCPLVHHAHRTSIAFTWSGILFCFWIYTCALTRLLFGIAPCGMVRLEGFSITAAGASIRHVSTTYYTLRGLALYRCVHPNSDSSRLFTPIPSVLYSHNSSMKARSCSLPAHPGVGVIHALKKRTAAPELNLALSRGSSQ